MAKEQKKKKRMKVWIVVYVWRGVETKVFLFKNEEDAQKKFEKLSKVGDDRDSLHITEEEVK